MKKILLALFLLSSLYSFAQPTIQWAYCYGGSGNDEVYTICQTVDGGFIITGNSISLDSQITNSHGGAWVVKLDALGLIQWEKTYGGSCYCDFIYSIIQTNEGGYILGGKTGSTDGDLSNSGYHGSIDAWVCKINDTGAIQWSKCYGGSGNEGISSIIQTNDNGYIFSGGTNSNNGDVSGDHGNNGDCWVVKLNDTGAIQWAKCYGGSASENGSSIQQTPDSGYVIAGYTSSNDGDVSGSHGNTDFWVIKIDTVGHLQWQKCYGGTSDDIGCSIVLTKDGGYAVSGETLSDDGDVSGNHGGNDFWLLKLNDTGAIQWSKCYGGSDDDEYPSLVQTIDSGFALAGTTFSDNGEVYGNHGNVDYWVVKTDANGNLQWSQCYGGSNWDEAFSIIQGSDGGLVIAGQTLSNNGNVTGYHGGLGDYWVVKLYPDTATGVEEVKNGNGGVSVYPNPVSSTLNINLSVIPTKEESLIITDVLGNIVYHQTLKNINTNVDVSAWSNGVYFYQLTNSTETYRGKFVKE